jgi:hypothetical protein
MRPTAGISPGVSKPHTPHSRCRTLLHPALLPCGIAAPTFVRCMFEGKKVGLKAYGTSAPRFERCSIEKCGEQGVRAMEASAPVLLG